MWYDVNYDVSEGQRETQLAVEMEKANGVDNKTESDSEPRDINRVNSNVRKKSEKTTAGPIWSTLFIWEVQKKI